MSRIKVIEAGKGFAATGITQIAADARYVGKPASPDAGDVMAVGSGGSVSNFKPGRIDARVRGLSTADSGSANATLLASLVTEAATNGAELWLPEGEYRGYFTPVSNLRVNGKGTLKAPTGLAASRQNVIKYDGAISNVDIRGITIDGNDEVGCIGLYGTTGNPVEHVAIVDVTMQNTAQSALGTYRDGVVFSTVEDFLIERCRFLRVGVAAGGYNPTNYRVLNNYVEGTLSNAFGALMSGGSGSIGSGNQWIGNVVVDAWRMGIELIYDHGTGGPTMDAPIIAHNDVTIDATSTDPDAMGYSIAGPFDPIIVANVARDPGLIGAYGFEVGGQSGYNQRTIAENVCYGFETGYSLYNTEYATVERNVSIEAHVGFAVGENSRGLQFTGNRAKRFRDTAFWFMGAGATRLNGGHTAIGNQAIRDLAWSGDGTRQWRGFQIDGNQAIPLKVDSNLIVWAETAPTAGLIGKGIAVESGDVAGVVTKTQGTNNRFVVLNSNTWESWSGWPTPKGELIRTGNTHTNAAGTITDANT